MSIGDEELERYSRQLVLPEWSGGAQERLAAASAMIIGAGALGSPAATYLAAAGVGRIGIVDGDAVELSNLQRQPLHFTPDIGLMKARNAAVKLTALNPHVQVETYPVRLEAANAAAIVDGADVVVDCSDSFETRYLVNEVCVEARIPLVEAGVLGFSGLVMSIAPARSACYRCVFAVPPAPGSVPTCREAGVLGAVAGIVGSLQALEAVKLLTGVGEPLLDRMLQVEGLGGEFATIVTERREDCPTCAGVSAAAQSAL